MKTNTHFFIISRSVLLRMRNFSDKFVQKIKTHFMFNKFFPPYCAIYETMWKNMVDPDRPQMAIYYCACAFHAG